SLARARGPAAMRAGAGRRHEQGSRGRDARLLRSGRHAADWWRTPGSARTSDAGHRRLRGRSAWIPLQSTQGDGMLVHRKARSYRWEGVQELPYKEDSRALFSSITRQVLFSDPALHSELRYFEVAAGGFSTLERHEHMHAVLVLRGRGHCLVGEE